MAFTLYFVVVVSIPVSILLFTLFTEWITFGVALLLHIIRSMLEVTLYCELSLIVSFSFTKWSRAFISSDFLSCVGEIQLNWDNSCCQWLTGLNNVSSTWSMVTKAALRGIAAPSVYWAIAILSVLVLNAISVKLLKRVQPIAVVSMHRILSIFST